MAVSSVQFATDLEVAAHSAFHALWAKTSKTGDGTWHPLILHLLDVAAAADALLAREPASTRERLAAALGLSWEAARPWLLLLIACHDLGKATPGFQLQWRLLAALNPGRAPASDFNHAFVSQYVLEQYLVELGWPEDLAQQAADAAGAHHGHRATPAERDRLASRRIQGGADWANARRAVFDALVAVFAPGSAPTRATLSGPDFMLLAGLVSFADWIGSNEVLFPFGTLEDCADPAAWYRRRRAIDAEQALESLHWAPRTPLLSAPKSFPAVFGFSPRPLQAAVADVLPTITRPSVLLVEAPMGEGKTEAAFYAHLELQRRFGHRGLYVALPTKATGNAMFARALEFLRRLDCARPLDLQLVHGGTLLNDTYQEIRLTGIHAPGGDGAVRAAEWFTRKKRALLSEYGVGTVDQALLAIQPVRHQFVRLWGLANRVVVFDEVHAYDAYTGTLLLELVHWLLAMGSSVVLLSATLPPRIRRQLAELTQSALPETPATYPRLTVFTPGATARSEGFAADPDRRQRVAVTPIAAELPALRAAVDARLTGGGYALALVNTVQRAQDLYRLYPDGEPIREGGDLVGKRLADGTEIYLFHARFPAAQRQSRENAILRVFGPKAPREGRKILIATQVAEQSLDLDFDLIATDLAPIDLLLQRLGRLWRHARDGRPLAAPELLVAGLDGEEPPAFGQPLWWSAVYREDLLLRTWCLLREMPTITVPDAIDRCVEAVYEGTQAVPDTLVPRLKQALAANEARAEAHTQAAHRSTLGSPLSGHWQSVHVRQDDENSLERHRSLVAQTRLGDDAVTVIPVWPDDGFDPAAVPTTAQEKAWFLRGLSVSRKSLVAQLRAQGAPSGWAKSPLLRTCIPLSLDPQSVFIGDARVRLDAELGLVYSPKESACNASI